MPAASNSSADQGAAKARALVSCSRSQQLRQPPGTGSLCLPTLHATCAALLPGHLATAAPGRCAAVQLSPCLPAASKWQRRPRWLPKQERSRHAAGHSEPGRHKAQAACLRVAQSRSACASLQGRVQGGPRAAAALLLALPTAAQPTPRLPSTSTTALLGHCMAEAALTPALPDAVHLSPALACSQ